MLDPSGPFFEAVFDAADVGLVALDRQLRIVAWNRWTASATDISADAAAGRTLSELFPKSDLGRLTAALEAALTSGASRLLSHRLHRALPPLVTRSGQAMIYDLAISPLGAQPFDSCLVQILDVTVATERERVLRARQNARYAAIVDNASDAILTLDADGVIRSLNRAAAEAFGYNEDELTGKVIHEVFDHSQAWMALWDEAGNGVAADPVELKITRKDGSVTYLEVSASGYQDDSRMFVSAILRDVNARYAAREASAQLNELNQAQLLVERDNAELREQFIAVLGHDLRNPLAAVVGAARLLRREVQSEKALKVLGMMEDSVGRMAGLIDDVLDFARGRLGGGITLDRKPAKLEPLLRQVVAELTSDRPDRQVDVAVDVKGLISFDKVRIGQLVSNLLGNAFTHGQPTEPVVLSATADGHQLVLSISNKGAPIPEAAMARLFQPFFRGEVRPSQQGLGLGLHIASEIARAHGGVLEVTSTAEGTTFMFRMPLVEA